MRTAFIDQLVKEARVNDKIFLLVGDLGYNVVEPFADEFPDRFRNVGIAEQNMAGVAAGLSMVGYNVYIYSIGNFPTLRCIEQIRNDIAYYKGNVKIVSVGAGYAYGSQGVSHHATEELGMMRSIPNIVVCSPCDPIEARCITMISANYDGPMYLRLGKAGEVVIHEQFVQDLNIGDILPVLKTDGTEKVILSSGSILGDALKSAKEKGVDIYSIPFVKPLNKCQMVDIANRYSDITILEENQKSCGVGSAVIEVISDLYCTGEIHRFPKIKRIAIEDQFYHLSGSQSYLRKQAGVVL